MTVLENIELCDNGYIEVKEVNIAQKIKLRTPSYGTISAKYSGAKKERENLLSNSVPTQSSAVTMPQTDVEIVSVVALNPRVAEMIQLLEINGRIKKEAYKALKIKPTMRENMEKNATCQKNDETVQETTIGNIEPLDQVGEEQSLQELEIGADTEEQKISKNGTTIARIEKFTTKLEFSEAEPVSPVIVEETTARPVSREIPLVAPERAAESVPEEEKNNQATVGEQASEAVQEAEPNDIEDIVGAVLPNNITDLAAIRDYLEKTARLKREAEQAKNKEEEAKRSAEKAEQEAADRRDELVKTAEKIAAHQEQLIAQTEKSKEQANIYDAKRGEYESETAEYQRAINDMLAIIGDSEQDNKGKTM